MDEKLRDNHQHCSPDNFMEIVLELAALLLEGLLEVGGLLWKSGDK